MALSSHIAVHTVDSDEELHARLYKDDLYGWQSRNLNNQAPLEDWLRENIVHAVESCPRVLAHWKKMVTSASVERRLCRYLGEALEGLPDKIKVNILSGRGAGKAQDELFVHISKKVSNWVSLSPSWIGEPKSDLRLAAVTTGWSDMKLFSQVPHSISRPEAERWTKWVPYAHSIGVFQRASKVAYLKKHLEEESPTITKTGQAWTRVEDMALAQSLIKNIPDCCYTLIPHPSALPVPIELQERMDAFVTAYEGLGMLSALKKMVLAGNVPAMCNEMAMELPFLGELDV